MEKEDKPGEKLLTVIAIIACVIVLNMQVYKIAYEKGFSSVEKLKQPLLLNAVAEMNSKDSLKLFFRQDTLIVKRVKFIRK